MQPNQPHAAIQVASPAKIWVATRDEERGPVPSPTTEATARAALAEAGVLTIEPAGGGLSEVGVYVVALNTVFAADPWSDPAYRALERRCEAAGLMAWAQAPVVTLWQVTTAEAVAERISDHHTVTPHPTHRTVPGMVRIDIYGAHLDQVFHQLDNEPLWNEEPEPCWCVGGCLACNGFRVVPAPRFGVGVGGP